MRTPGRKPAAPLWAAAPRLAEIRAWNVREWLKVQSFLTFARAGFVWVFLLTSYAMNV
jgi:hypothetical protein